MLRLIFHLQLLHLRAQIRVVGHYVSDLKDQYLSIKVFSELASPRRAGLFVSACSKQNEVISLAGSTMGTTYHIKVVPNEQMPTAQLLQAEIDLALELVNDQMSTYRPHSNYPVSTNCH